MDSLSEGTAERIRAFLRAAAHGGALRISARRQRESREASRPVPPSVGAEVGSAAQRRTARAVHSRDVLLFCTSRGIATDLVPAILFIIFCLRSSSRRCSPRERPRAQYIPAITLLHEPWHCHICHTGHCSLFMVVARFTNKQCCNSAASCSSHLQPCRAASNRSRF